MSEDTRGKIIDLTSAETPDAQPRDPSKRRLFKAVAGTAAASALGGFLAGRVTAPASGEAPRAASTASQAATIPQTGKNRETVDLSFSDFVALSHKEQDQKMKELTGKNLVLAVDKEAFLLKTGLIYYKDGQEYYAGSNDKLPEGAQVTREHYIINVRNRQAKESTGLDFFSFDVVFPAYTAGNKRRNPTFPPSKDEQIKSGHYEDYTAYINAYREAEYIKEYLDNLWIRTDPKGVPYKHVGDTNSRDLPVKTVFNFAIDNGAKFLGVTLPPEAPKPTK